MEYLRSLTPVGTRTAQKYSGEVTQASNSLRVPIQNIAQTLADPHRAGIIISGPTGSGRRALLEAAVSQLNVSTQQFRLNGSNYGTKVPLGVLSFVLAQLEVGPNPSRHELIHGLGRIFSSQGGASIVVLGYPELIDEQSASLLAQLAAMGKIKIAVICQRVQDLPGDLFALYRSGRIAHEYVQRLGINETQKILEHELGSRVSSYTSAALCYLTGGNRNLSLKLIQIWREEGQLVLHNGTWTLNIETMVAGPSMVSLYQSMTRRLDASVRELLQALALCGPVHLKDIHRTGMTHQLDELLNHGLVSYLPESDSSVGIQTPLLAMLARADHLEGRAEETTQLLARLHVDPYASQVHTSVLVSRDLGDYASLVRVADEFKVHGYEPSGWCTNSRARIDIVKIHSRTLAMLGRALDARDVIVQAKEGLARAIAQSDSSENLDLAFQEIALLSQSAAQFSSEGKIEPEVVLDGQRPVTSTYWISESLHLRALALQAASWAGKSRQDDSWKLVRYIDEQLRSIEMNSSRNAELDSSDASEIEVLLLQAEMLAGRWNLAEERAQRLSEGQYGNPMLSTYGVIVRGILTALGNDHDSTLQQLEPCLHQLQVSGHRMFEPVTCQVLAYALACSGRRQEATEMVALHEPASPGHKLPLGFYSWVSEIFTSLAIAELGSPQQALLRLKAFVSRAQEFDQVLLEALTLAFILRLGDRDVLPQLLSAAHRCKGLLGSILLTLAEAVETRDSARLATALHQLIMTGNMLLDASAHNEFQSLLDAKDQRRLARMVNSLRRAAVLDETMASEPNVMAQEPQLSWTRSLTKREAQIAKMAIAGKTNLEIAKYSGVSIRTVEGHLYQVYSKLQIRNRQELTALDRSSRRTAGLR